MENSYITIEADVMIPIGNDLCKSYQNILVSVSLNSIKNLLRSEDGRKLIEVIKEVLQLTECSVVEFGNQKNEDLRTS